MKMNKRYICFCIYFFIYNKYLTIKGGQWAGLGGLCPRQASRGSGLLDTGPDRVSDRVGRVVGRVGEIGHTRVVFVG